MNLQETMMELKDLQTYSFGHIRQTFGLDKDKIRYQLSNDECEFPNTVLVDMSRVKDLYSGFSEENLHLPFEYDVVKQWIQIGLRENVFLYDKDPERLDSAVNGFTIGHLDNHSLYKNTPEQKDFLNEMVKSQINNASDEYQSKTMLSKLQQTRVEGLKTAVDKFYQELEQGADIKAYNHFS